MRSCFFKILALALLLGTTILAVGDAARSVAKSQLIWTDFDHFLTQNMPFDITSAKLYVLIKTGSVFFENFDAFVLQAPSVVVFAALATLCMLLSYRRPKS